MEEQPAKVRLSRLIGCKPVKIRYEDAPNGDTKMDKRYKLPVFPV